MSSTTPQENPPNEKAEIRRQNEMSIEEYIAMQPRLAWRRAIIRGAIRFFIMTLLCKVKITGEENIPATGSAMLMMNHLSLLDPVVCIGAVRHRFVVPMTKVENMKMPIMGSLIRWYGAYSVNRGEVDRRALTSSIELIKAGQLVLIAPEGTRQRDGLAEAKDGFVYVATKANPVIIPAAVTGVQDWMNELKRLKRPNITVTFGKPFKFKTQGRTRIPREEMTAMSHEAMYQLAATLPDPALRGKYADLSKLTTHFIEFV